MSFLRVDQIPHPYICVRFCFRCGGVFDSVRDAQILDPRAGSGAQVIGKGDAGGINGYPELSFCWANVSAYEALPDLSFDRKQPGIFHNVHGEGSNS